MIGLDNRVIKEYPGVESFIRQKNIFPLETFVNNIVTNSINNGGGSGGSDTDWVEDTGVVYNLNENIGIGTSLPDTKLDVAGDIRFNYQNSGSTGNYMLEIGAIDISSIAPGITTEGLKFSVKDSAGNGVEELMIADDNVVGILGYWRKSIQATDGGNTQTSVLEAGPDGLTFNTSLNSNSAIAGQVRATAGGVALTSQSGSPLIVAAMQLDANGFTFTMQPNTSHNFTIENLRVFETNALAQAGGLGVNNVYRNSAGDLKIVV